MKVKLDVPPNSYKDLASIYGSKVKNKRIYAPYQSTRTYANMKSNLGAKTKLSKRDHQITISILPPNQVKDKLSIMFTKLGSKPFFLYIRWFQLGASYVQRILERYEKPLYLIMPRENKQMQKDNGQVVRIASSFVWLTNRPCKPKLGIVCYRLL